MTVTADERHEPSTATQAEPAIRSFSLTKRFGSLTAVDHIALDVPRASVYGFLGPNGSGKTTTIRMLLGLVAPTDGRVELLGRRMPADAGLALVRVGALIEGPAFHPYLSGYDNLRRVDAADPVADPHTVDVRIDAALDRVGLRAAAGKRYRSYSLGMRQRLGLAAALLRPRDLLVLDEPTNGLDPQGTREVRALLAELALDGTTIFVSSHLLSEVEQICSHVGIMSKGRLVWQGPLSDLSTGGARRLHVRTPDTDVAIAALSALGITDVRVRHEAGESVLDVDAGSVPVEAVADAVVRAGARLRGLVETQARLEDQFLALTGEGFDVAG